MPKMISTKAHPYRGRNWVKDDVLEVDAQHVKLLVGLGRVRVYVEPVSPIIAPIEETEERVKRAYKRRDLTAET